MNKKEKEIIVETLLYEIKQARYWAQEWLNTDEEDRKEECQSLSWGYHERARVVIELLKKLDLITAEQGVELSKDINDYIPEL